MHDALTEASLGPLNFEHSSKREINPCQIGVYMGILMIYSHGDDITPTPDRITTTPRYSKKISGPNFAILYSYLSLYHIPGACAWTIHSTTNRSPMHFILP